MVKIVKIILGLLIIAVAVLSFVDKKVFDNEDELTTVLEARKVIISYKDKTLVDSLSNIFLESIKTNDLNTLKVIDEIKLKYDDVENRENTNDDEFKTLIEVISTKNKTLKEIHLSNLELLKDSKNEVVFRYEESKLKDSPNIWLIILIILLAGFIGGIARTNWSLLLELGKDVKNVEIQLKKCEDKMELLKNDSVKASQNNLSTFVNRIKTIQNDVQSVKQLVDEVKSSKSSKAKALFASIIFGIIASSISLLALNLTESKILDFEKPIDYFILWGWCVLGAIYAKKWIESLYGKISKK